MSSPDSFVTPSEIASSSQTPPLLKAQADICVKTNGVFRDRQPDIVKLQHRLEEDVKTRANDESWDETKKELVHGWLQDVEVSWRFLRKSLFDQEKAYDAALEALDKIYENGLLSPAIPEDIYPPAPGNPPLFTILPYPDHTDPLDRPVAVVSLRSLSKESTSEGKERVKSWCWWCAEITRRCLQDADAQRRERGERGQELRATGCALIVDLANAGMKNVDLDMVPHLLSILQTYYPGLFSTIYIVNHSWTHSSLWTVVKRFLPKSALDRVRFIYKGELGQVMDLDKIPEGLGGKSQYNLQAQGWPDSTVERYSFALKTSPTTTMAVPTPMTIPTTTNPTTKTKNQKNGTLSEKVSSKALEHPRLAAATPTERQSEDEVTVEADEYVPPEDYMDDEDQFEKEAYDQEKQKPFELYLTDHRTGRLNPPNLHSSHRNSALGLVTTETRPDDNMSPLYCSPLLTHTSRPRLGTNASERSYSAQLQQHHFRRLSQTRALADRHKAKEALLGRNLSGPSPTQSKTSNETKSEVKTGGLNATESPDLVEATLTTCQASSVDRADKPNGISVSAYDQQNPMFGYPVVMVPKSSLATNIPSDHLSHIPQEIRFTSTQQSVIVPLYGRRRKRDLIKTLFLLGIMRLVGIKDWISALWTDVWRLVWGLLVLRRWWGSMSYDSQRGRSERLPDTPSSGLTRERQLQSTRYQSTRATAQASSSTELVAMNDWIWLILSLLVVRDGWSWAVLHIWDQAKKAIRVVWGRIDRAR